MLLVFVFRLKRPAALFSRRSFLLLLTALVGLGGWAAASVHRAGRTEARFSVEASRDAVRRALRTVRPDLPDTARLIDRLVADAEVSSAQETHALPWDRSPGRAESAWVRVHTTTRQALLDIRSRTAVAAGRWKELSAAATAQVRQALEEAGEAGVGAREAAAARRAEYHLDLAEKYAATGAFDRANVAAMMALDFSQIVHKSWKDLHARFGDSRNLTLWRSWVNDTIALSRRDGISAIVVDKLKRRLHVYQRGERIATLEAELGAKGLRRKLHSGDQATPEGRYRVVQVKEGRSTKYYKALLINYPNSEDHARYRMARATGQVPGRAGIGNLIEIHGDGGQGRDWTNGCVALSNKDMDYVFARSRVGTPVTIVGTF